MGTWTGGEGALKKRFSAPVLAMMAGLLFSGCAPVVVGGGGAVMTSMLGERRTADNYLEDNWVAWKIRSYYVRSDKIRAGNINVSVYNGKVLLTGAASSEEEIAEAIRIAKATRGVWQVNSEIKVQFESASELAADVLISNRVKLKLLADKNVRGLDIHVETTKAVVFLTGEAQTVGERDRAVDIARTVPGVREVVSYIGVIQENIPPRQKTASR